jgi:2-methylisocitrate lyase-like PEP mutase family enzyme
VTVLIDPRRAFPGALLAAAVAGCASPPAPVAGSPDGGGQCPDIAGTYRASSAGQFLPFFLFGVHDTASPEWSALVHFVQQLRTVADEASVTIRSPDPERMEVIVTVRGRPSARQVLARSRRSPAAARTATAMRGGAAHRIHQAVAAAPPTAAISTRESSMESVRPSIADRRRTFQRLHASGCFVIPNPWDAGSARCLQGLGFQALATTSAGFAWSKARPDNGVTRAMVVAHLHEVVETVDVPVNADFESGFARDADGVADSVRHAIEAGVAGLSIEDSTGDAARPLYDRDMAVERLRAARRAIDRAGGDTLLVGRSEGFIVGRPDLDETLARLRAYADAGADCLYAPGLRTREQIAAVVAAVAPSPVNVLIGWADGMSVDDIAALGVRRISVGGALARCAWGGFLDAARQLAERGSFEGLRHAVSGTELDEMFGGR